MSVTKTVKAGIVGGAGYTAGELLRLLIHHPAVEIVFVNSSSNAGNKLCEVHSGLIGDTELCFTDELPFEKVDVLFFCTAHGDTKKFLDQNVLPKGLKVIDLSTDYRPRTNDGGFLYGLPELNGVAIQTADRIANPGCFATGIQLALLPLAQAGLLRSEIHVNATTGSTGAGQRPTESTHFSWRNNNLSVYKPFQHQHLAEIGESLAQLQPGVSAAINFIPVRGNFARGIFITAYTDCERSLDEMKQLYEEFYKEAAFTHVTDSNIDLKQVVGTNKCLIHLEKHNGKIFIIAVVDNLLKGASGQAVHNMNLMFGLEEKCGLNLKSIAF